MSTGNPIDAGYITVAERIEAFYEKYPDGSLQSEIVELTPDRVTFKAYAYRSPDDQRPGIGHSSLGIPGATPYTRGSEIENAETSSFGRAIAALGFEVKAGVATADEVANKQGTAARQAPDAAPTVSRTAPPEPSPDEPNVLTFPPRVADPGSCPKHGTPYADGQYGPYCRAQSDDPAWANARGYCRITPKNAAQWVKVNR